MKQYRLPKSCLLRKKGEFDCVYRQGKRLHGQGFSIIFAVNAVGRSRLGISVQKKVGNAVQRNRIKRIVRESFRLNREQFPKCCDIVVTVRPDFSCRSPAGLLTAVTGLVRRHGVDV